MKKFIKTPAMIVLASMLIFPAALKGEAAAPARPDAGVDTTVTTETAFASPDYGTLNLTKKSYVKNELIVKYKNSLVARALKERLGLKTSRKFNSFNGELVKIPATKTVGEVMKLLQASGLVEYAVPNYKRQFFTADPRYSELWGLKNTGQPIQYINGKSGMDLNVENAWAKTKGNPSVTVAIVDTGIDISHPDLKNSIWRNPGETAGDGKDNDHNGYIDDVNGWDFFHKDRTVFDDPEADLHATHVAGTIAAAENDLGIVGIAPNVKVMPLKFIGDDGSGEDADAIAAIEYAKAKGVRIFNLSWGGYGDSPALYDAMKNSNALFIAAAGNEGWNNDTVHSLPSSFDLPNIISVAAMNNKGYIACFSNYGKATVDIAAPGRSILSTIPGNKYAYEDGTSMAAPHVTGAAALALSAHPELSNAQLKDLILKTSVALPPEPENYCSGKPSRKILTGSMVNAGNAVNYNYSLDDELPGVPLAGARVTGSLGENGDREDVYSVRLQKGEKLSLKLNGVTGSDYNLYVYDRSAFSLSAGNKISARSETAGTSAETIYFRAPATGTFYIRVAWVKGAGPYTLKSVLGDPSAVYENSWPGAVYSSGWVKTADSSASGGDYHSAGKSGAKMQFIFNGTGIRLTALKNSLQGYAKISVDGSSNLVNLYSASREYNSAVFEKKGLDAGKHVLTVEWTGKLGNASASASKSINIDTITVLGGSSLYLVQENAQGIRKTGIWSTSKNSGYSGGMAMYTGTAGSSVELPFTGTGVKVLASKAGDRGLLDVYIDGKFDRTIDTYSAVKQYQAEVYASTGLAPGSHLLKIVAKGKKAAASAGTAVYIDAFNVAADKQTTVQESSVARSGSWTKALNSRYSGGNAVYALKAGSSVQLAFTGSSIKVFGVKGTLGGLADVYMDGVKVATINTYSPSTIYKGIVFEKSGLKAGNHVIRIVVKGQKASASAGTRVYLDALLVN